MTDEQEQDVGVEIPEKLDPAKNPFDDEFLRNIARTAALARPEFMVDEFNVTVPVGIRPVKLADLLAVAMNDIVLPIYKYLVDQSGNTDVGAVGVFGGLVIEMATTRAEIFAGTVRPADLGKLNPEKVEELRKTYSHVLSGYLSKLNKAAAFARRKGLRKGDGVKEVKAKARAKAEKAILDALAAGATAKWVTEGLVVTCNRMHSLIRKMVALEFWAERKDARPKDTIDDAIEGMIDRAASEPDRYIYQEEDPAVPGVVGESLGILRGDSLPEG